MDDRGIPSSVRIGAVLRQMDAQFIPYYVLQRGNEFSGTLLLSLLQADRTVKILSERRNDHNKPVFTKIHKEESLAPADADEYIRRAISRDPDLWVIEIETKNNVNPFETENSF